MKSHPFGSYLLNLEKPGRYLGTEFNAVRKEITADTVRVGLLYPETYEIGMSNLGLKIIYHVFNKFPNVYAERIFLPWIDAIQYMKEKHIPLFTLETLTPVRDLDFLGVSLHTELNYTNLLAALELSDIPLKKDDREGGGYPLVVVGGPASFNPLPLEPFVDFFVIGDGEEVVKQVVPLLRERKSVFISKDNFLKEVSKLSGVYVPGYSGKVRKGEAYFESSDFPVNQIVPSIEVVHHRYVIEVMRGCTRGCRFCQGGFTYRPLRIREPEEVFKLAKEGIARTGFDEIGLLAFSISDYPYLADVIRLFKRYLKDVHVSLPSLPVNALDKSLLTEFDDLRRFGITLAPEVVSEKLRRIINKNVSLQEIYNSIDTAMAFNFRHVKLYLMIGVPGESTEDIEELGYFLKDLARRYPRITFRASISPFVPRPHTPFQFVAQDSVESVLNKISYLKGLVKNLRNLQVSFHDPYMSMIEGIMGRGDEKLAEVLLEAFKNGAIFDSRSEFFDVQRYKRAMDKKGLNPEEYLRERSTLEELPWEFIDTGVLPQYLREEYNKSLRDEYTEDCMKFGCNGCGVWSKDGYELCLKGIEKREVELPDEKPPFETQNITGYVLSYKILDTSRFISQRDIAKLLVNFLRVTGVRLKYTKGFTPRPRISMPNPLPLGVESEEEYLYFESEEIGDLNRVLKDLNEASIDGLQFISIRKVYEKPRWSLYSTALFELEEGDSKSMFEVDLSRESLTRALADRFGIQKSDYYKVRIKKLKVLR
ncbi:MAG: TIGR03936 family radical SAM-associated protein [Candidatus Hydrothermia bacterium]